MEQYQKYSVTIKAEDRTKADDILLKHWYAGDLDDVGGTMHKNSDGGWAVTYWIRPYIYEDYEAILNEFKEAGIQTF